LVQVVREQALQERVCLRALDLDLSHVRDVEYAGVGAHCTMLLDHALVLDGHLPAGERNHARAEGDVAVVERRLQQCLRHAETILVSALRPAFSPKRGCPGVIRGWAGAADRVVWADSQGSTLLRARVSYLAADGTKPQDSERSLGVAQERGHVERLVRNLERATRNRGG